MSKPLSNPEKVAVLLTILGEDLAAEIFRELSSFEIQRIVRAMQSLQKIDAATVDAVAGDFHHLIVNKTKALPSGQDFLKRLATKDQSLQSIQKDAEAPTLDAVQLFEPKDLAELIKRELPQTAALILAFTDAKKAGDTLKHLPQPERLEILIRIARLEAVQPSTIAELNEHLREESVRRTSHANRSIGGVDKVAGIMAHLDKSVANDLLDKIGDRDQSLRMQVSEKMFLFDDLAKVHDKSIQDLLKIIPQSTLKLALRSCSDAVKKTFLRNLSTRAASMLEDDLAAMGPTRATDVQIAQRAIIAEATKMKNEDRLIMTDSSEFV